MNQNIGELLCIFIQRRRTAAEMVGLCKFLFTFVVSCLQRSLVVLSCVPQRNNDEMIVLQNKKKICNVPETGKNDHHNHIQTIGSQPSSTISDKNLPILLSPLRKESNNRCI